MEQERYSALLDLLLVSRQFSDEVTLTVYSKRQFRFYGPGDLWHVDRLGEKQQHLITDVLLYLTFSPCRPTSWTDYIKPAKSLLQLKGVKTITVRICRGSMARANRPFGGYVRFSEELSVSKSPPALESATISFISSSRDFDDSLKYIDKYGDWYLGKVRDLILGDL